NALPALDFLRRRFGRSSLGLYVLLWQLRGKVSHWLRADQLNESADLLSRLCLPGAGNVYVGAALSPEDYGPGQRCPADQAAGIVGLWADIDLAGAAHKSAKLPGTVEEAQALASSLGMLPTEEVATGHGLQPWWLFEEPWIFGSDEERRQAQELVRRFQGRLRQKSREQNWDLDSTHDLARALRLAGTWKREVAP